MRYLLAVVVGLMACAVPAPPPVSLEYRLQMDPCTGGVPGVLPGTVHVTTSTGRCTGVVISRTEVVTAGHCVDSAIWAFVHFDADKVPVTYAAVNGPWGEDIALLGVTVPANAHVSTLGDTPDFGAPVTFSGYGCGGGHGRTRHATAGALLLGTQSRRYDGCACRGDSGGPVFDREGNVVGVMTHTNLVDRSWATEFGLLSHLRVMLNRLKAQDHAPTDPAPQ